MRSIYLTVVIVALSLIASSLPLKNAQAATLGYTTIGAQTDSSDSNFINATKFTMPNGSGTVTSMSVYIAIPVSAAPNNQFQLAIYSDSAGSPGSLIASSQSGVITPNAWNTAAVVANLSANATYWLAYNTNGTASANNNCCNCSTARSS